jgi:hypothetical protein
MINCVGSSPGPLDRQAIALDRRPGALDLNAIAIDLDAIAIVRSAIAVDRDTSAPVRCPPPRGDPCQWQVFTQA